MDSEINYFLELSSCAIHGKDASPITKVDTNWNHIMSLARIHNMSAILYKTISKLKPGLQPEERVLQQWKTEAFYQGLHQLGQHQELQALLEEAKQKGISLLPFKGLLLASLYPEPLMRTSSDADILVANEDKDGAIELLTNRGFLQNDKETTETVFVYDKPGTLTVELHTSLWEEYIGDRINRLESLHLTSPETLIQVNACDIDFITLGYEQHLVYQIYHIIKHFSLSGVGVRHLTDITLYVNTYYEQIDFLGFWKTMEHLNYTTCCYCFFKICVDCLGMKPEAIKDCKCKTNMEIKHLIEDIIDGGVFGNAKDERYHARNIVKPYLKNEKKVELSKQKMLLRILFPGVEMIQSQYPYAKRHRILVPFAWIQRDFYLIRKHFGKAKDSYGEKTLNQAKCRLQLLRELDIINK